MRWRSLAKGLVALATLAVVGASAAVLLPRELRRRAIAHALDEVREGKNPEQILDWDDPAAVVGLVEIYAARRDLAPTLRPHQTLTVVASVEDKGYTGPPPEWIVPRSTGGGATPGIPLREAVELLAAGPHGGDAEVALALERLAREGTLEQRFEACYLRGELAHPTFPAEPEGFSARASVELPPFEGFVSRPSGGGVTVTARQISEELAPIRNATEFEIDARESTSFGPRIGRIEDRPWRALLRVAQALPGGRVSVDRPPDRRVVVERGLNSRLLEPVLASGLLRASARFSTVATRRVAVAGAAGLLHRLSFLLNEDIHVIPPDKLELIPEEIVLDDTDVTRALLALAALNGLEAHRRAGEWSLGRGKPPRSP